MDVGDPCFCPRAAGGSDLGAPGVPALAGAPLGTIPVQRLVTWVYAMGERVGSCAECLLSPGDLGL